MEKGLIQIYTGCGKGKSTAAFGLALRASGWGMNCAVVQFMKDGEGYGEIAAFAGLPNIKVYSYGISGFLKKGCTPPAEAREKAEEAMKMAAAFMRDDNIDILILDELCNAVYFDLVSEEDALALMEAKREGQELIITGRNATDAMMAKADLVTEMKQIKHPYEKGISARKGIEY